MTAGSCRPNRGARSRARLVLRHVDLDEGPEVVLGELRDRSPLGIDSGFPADHHDDPMRTTLTLDPDVAQLIEEEVHRRRTTFKQVVNDAIRSGLQAPRRRARRYRAPVLSAELAPGVDPAGFNRLADDLEAEAVISGRER